MANISQHPTASGTAVSSPSTVRMQETKRKQYERVGIMPEEVKYRGDVGTVNVLPSQ